MTGVGPEVAAPWLDPEFARSWAEADRSSYLDLPRAMVGVLASMGAEPVALIVDVASGPGDFLAALLDHFPDAAGVWTDASEAMLALARENLARFGSRVSYHLADMTQLASTEIPDWADLVVTSRASHHLDSSGLAEFYRAACGRLAPGGWLFNLDHVGLGAPWDRRLLEVREHLFGASGAQSNKHRHDRLLPSVRDHLDALAASDFGEFDMPWRAFRTCLFAARKRSAPATLVR